MYSIRAVVGICDGTSVDIVALVGPTATGKTETAVRLALALNGEIISADSVAVYRRMDIGAAKPSEVERKLARFHLIDVVEPDKAFNAAIFKRLAEEAISDIRARGKTPIVAGGTGLYVRALLENYSLTETVPDLHLRTELEAEAKCAGVPAMHDRLAGLDPKAASRIHSNDLVRIVRALEVILRTGKTISDQHEEDARSRIRKPAHKFALTASRDELIRRIDARVDRMIARGLEQEVRDLESHGFGRELPSMRTLGYKEMMAYINNECDLQHAVSEIKKNTRRFAKRQLTWFRAEKNLEWIYVDNDPPPAVASRILERLKCNATL